MRTEVERRNAAANAAIEAFLRTVSIIDGSDPEEVLKLWRTRTEANGKRMSPGHEKQMLDIGYSIADAVLAELAHDHEMHRWEGEGGACRD
jgi:hypothetical protein